MHNRQQMEGIPGSVPSLWLVSADLCSLFVSPGCAHFIPPFPCTHPIPPPQTNPERCCRYEGAPARAALSPKKKNRRFLDASKTEQLEARRGKRTGHRFPPRRSRRRKSKGSERGDMEREGGGARRPPHFSSPLFLLSLPPSLFLHPPLLLLLLFFFPPLLSFLEKVAGQS